MFIFYGILDGDQVTRVFKLRWQVQNLKEKLLADMQKLLTEARSIFVSYRTL